MMESQSSRTQPRVGVYREKPGSDIVKQGYLKKMKTMKKKYFVLRSTSSSGPARLDYYDSEKKFKSGHTHMKRSIPLHTCFNINKRVDTKHKFALSLFLAEDCFSVLAENEEEQQEWLDRLLEYQNEYLVDGEQPKFHYDLVWQGVIKHKTPKSCRGILGPYRLCLSEKSVCLVKTKEIISAYTFQFSSIRRCGHSDNLFFMEVGRSSVTGAGELWMQVDETVTAESMHNAVLGEMHKTRSSESTIRPRSNTGSSSIGPIRSSGTGDGPFHRKRATSESHHGSHGPQKSRANIHRPVSTVVFTTNNLNPKSPNAVSSSPGRSLFDYAYDEERKRSDSMSSRSSRASHHDAPDGPSYENIDPSHSHTPESSYRSSTPESSYPFGDHSDDHMEPSDYLSMTPGQRSPSPSPTRGPAVGGDYLPMTPGQQSGTPSPTRHMERPGSAGSDGHELSSRSEGYMEMRPGSLVSSPASNHSSFMDMTPPASVTTGYIDMTPGQRTPTDPGPSYMVMDTSWSRTTAPIPIRNKESGGYIDMGPASQPLPTVKEGGSGEAYLPMTPTGQSPMSSIGLKPAKVISYLSDDSMSGEFPKRAYSVGSRPVPKPSHRHHQAFELLRRQPLDSSRSSSAPHLIVQKPRQPPMDMYRNPYMDTSQCASPLSQSIKSDDSDSFMEMDFYRPRTASDSYGSRQRSSSFGKQFLQGHRPRSSSYGQASRGKLAKIVSCGRTDSFESIRTTSQELNQKQKSQESLSKFSSSSRNSSSESLKKLSEDLKHRKSLTSEYMDMGFEKRKTPSPNVQGIVSPKVDTTGYVDMTLGTSAPKSSSRGISPSSSIHSLGSSPASTGHGYYEKSQDAKIIKASGKAMQKQTFGSQFASPGDLQQKLVGKKIRKSDKRSPSSSGKESEDESYVPFQPITAAISHDDGLHRPPAVSYDLAIPKGPSGLKVQHGYSKSFDSAVMEAKPKSSSKHDKHLKLKIEDKSKSKRESDSGKSEKESKSNKLGSKGEKPGKKNSSVPAASAVSPSANMDPLLEKVAKGCSPTLDKKLEFIPDTDLFSNKVFQGPRVVSEGSFDSDNTGTNSTSASTPEQPKADTSAYMDYNPAEESNVEPPLPREAAKGKDSASKVQEKVFSPPPRPVRHVEREYCEIDLPSGKCENPDDATVAESTEKSSSRCSGAKPKSPRSSQSSAKENENFTYMDFDPAVEKKKEEDDSEIKAPHRVRSFLAHGAAESELAGPAVHSPKHKKSGVSSAGAVHSPKHEESCVSPAQPAEIIKPEKDIRRLSMENKENFNSQNLKCVGDIFSQRDIKNTMAEVKEKENKGLSEVEANIKAVIGDPDEKVIAAKFVVKRTKSAHSEPEVVEDEGYVDLDFSEAQGHRRSSSSSSSNSDRSRKVIQENEPSCDDDLPCPETPISYICEDEPTVTEPSSPFKMMGKRVRQASGQSQGDAAGIARQCSVPAVPSCNQRSGVESNPGRSRKASGPAGYPPVSKSGNGAGVGGKRCASASTQQGLQPVLAGQELHKQKSMPCMVVPVNLEKKRVGESFQEIGQSRHSFTDLTQYEEMSFPAAKLATNKGRSNSQQQLSDSSKDKCVLNYAQLELHGSTEHVEERSPRVKSRHPSSIEDLTPQGDASPISYAEIDYDKTESMKNTGNREVKFTLGK